MHRPNRRTSSPVLAKVSTGSMQEAVRLERLAFSRHTLSESWLQELIFEKADMLPIEDVEPEYAPLLGIGREVPTGAGPIDALYISPDGLLTLVEAKLWRNPEARREVVGQIIDYAQQMSTWSYDDLDQRVRRLHGIGLWERVTKLAGDELPIAEPEFVDAVTRNLARGRFLLLVVGDGIKESVEDLAAYLQGTPNLRFTLALVELRLYAVPGDAEQVLVVPSVVARTREVVRSIVEVSSSHSGVGSVQVRAVEVDSVTATSSSRGGNEKRQPLDESSFVSTLIENTSPEDGAFLSHFFRHARELGAEVDFGTSRAKLKLPDPGGSGRTLSVLGFTPQGGFYISLLASQTTSVGYAYEGGPAQAYIDTVSDLAEKSPIPLKDSDYPERWETPAPLSKLRENEAAVLAAIRELGEGLRDQPTATS